jgi:L-alanine-DL-glutamate epimerase-like enolase superfamily enzyme
LVRPIALVASMTLPRAFREESQLQMMDSVRPCVSGFGGIG